MGRVLSVVKDFLLVMGVMLMVPFAILLFGLPIVAVVKLLEFLVNQF